MITFLVLIVIAALLFLWWDGMASKEIAREAGARACREARVQFLDDTVALHKLRLRRGPRGALQLYREYGFEFTRYGEARHRGHIQMLGQRITGIELDPELLRQPDDNIVD